jgi:hypothetical protein
LNGVPLASVSVRHPPRLHWALVVGTDTTRQSALLVEPVVAVVVPAGHGVAAVAPIVLTYEPIGAGIQLDCPVLG